MDFFHLPFIFTIAGLLLVTIIAIAGSILSRVLKFNSTVLTPISIAIYIALSYLISKETGLGNAIISCVAVSIYDSIIGWELSKKFNANIGALKEETENIPVHSRVFIMVLISTFLAFIGYWIS
jgi:hypothetical protein